MSDGSQESAVSPPPDSNPQRYYRLSDYNGLGMQRTFDIIGDLEAAGYKQHPDEVREFQEAENRWRQKEGERIAAEADDIPEDPERYRWTDGEIPDGFYVDDPTVSYIDVLNERGRQQDAAQGQARENQVYFGQQLVPYILEEMNRYQYPFAIVFRKRTLVKQFGEKLGFVGRQDGAKRKNDEATSRGGESVAVLFQDPIDHVSDNKVSYILAVDGRYYRIRASRFEWEDKSQDTEIKKTFEDLRTYTTKEIEKKGKAMFKPHNSNCGSIEFDGEKIILTRLDKYRREVELVEIPQEQGLAQIEEIISRVGDKLYRQSEGSPPAENNAVYFGDSREKKKRRY